MTINTDKTSSSAARQGIPLEQKRQGSARAGAVRAGAARVVVVGSGLAGLTTALLLAKEGLLVTVLEKAPHAGGRATSTHDHDFWLNLGPRAVYAQGLAHRTFQALEVPVVGGKPPLSGLKAYHGGRLHTLPTGLGSFLSTSLLPFSARLEALTLLPRLSGMSGATLEGRSVTDWLAQTVQQPALREYLEALIRVNTYVSAPELLDASVALSQLQHSLKHGVLYLDGGWQSLVDGLVTRCQALGVEVLTGARVKAVTRGQAGGYEVMRANAAPLPADAVVLAVEPGLVRELVEGLVEGLEPTSKGTGTPVGEKLLSVHAACLDLALKTLPNPGLPFVLGVDQPLYLSVHSLTAKLHPAGGAVIHLMKYLTPGQKSDPHAEQQQLEQLMDVAQPGWRELVVERRFLPHMAVMHALPTVASGGLKGRPGVSVPGLPGLFQVGDWVGAEGLLLDGAIASATTGAQAVISWTRSTGRAPLDGLTALSGGQGAQPSPQALRSSA